MRFLYRRVGDELITNNEKSNTRRMPIYHNSDTNFSSKVHVLVGTLVPVVSTNNW